MKACQKYSRDKIQEETVAFCMNGFITFLSQVFELFFLHRVNDTSTSFDERTINAANIYGYT